MNIIEALTLAKEHGRKVKPVGETAVCLVYIKSRDKFDMRNIETNKYVNTFDRATIKGIFADWEVVKEKPSKETQCKIDSMKFQIVRYCDKNADCDDCYECKIRRICHTKPYSPLRMLLDDWSLKEIVEAYHVLKKAGEI